MKKKVYRFEWETKDLETWGFDFVIAPNYTTAKEWIFENYKDVVINYIAELKYERPIEEDL